MQGIEQRLEDLLREGALNKREAKWIPPVLEFLDRHPERPPKLTLRERFGWILPSKVSPQWIDCVLYLRGDLSYSELSAKAILWAIQSAFLPAFLLFLYLVTLGVCIEGVKYLAPAELGRVGRSLAYCLGGGIVFAEVMYFFVIWPLRNRLVKIRERLTGGDSERGQPMDSAR